MLNPKITKAVKEEGNQYTYVMRNFTNNSAFPIKNAAYVLPSKDFDGISIRDFDKEFITYFDFKNMEGIDKSTVEAVLNILTQIVTEGKGVPITFDWATAIEAEETKMLSEMESEKPQGKKKHTENTNG